MKIHDCPLAGPKIIELNLVHDNRGFFSERYNEDAFRAHGLPTNFVQDNHSRSLPGVIRGLHYQFSPPQGKLVGALSGRAWDVAVDVRPNSPTFGKWHGVELSGDNGILFWIPPGFAHGFCILGDEPADMLYKITAPWRKDGEGGIRFDDPDLAIDWPVKNPIISERDRVMQSFKEYKNNLPKW